MLMPILFIFNKLNFPDYHKQHIRENPYKVSGICGIIFRQIKSTNRRKNLSRHVNLQRFFED